MTPPAEFEYVGVALEPARREVRCTYRIGHEEFIEIVTLTEGDLTRPGVAEAATLYFLLAGVSYLKTRAPLVVDLGTLPTTPAERAFLATYLIEGLGEFAFRNDLDLRSLEVRGPDADVRPIDAALDPDRVLIPFGGGLDSIVTVAELGSTVADAALFVAERPGARFDAIERPAAKTGLPVLRAERQLDPKVLDSAAHGYLNGHVPVTGVLSAAAVLCAVANGFGAVAMSNERSASSATLEGPTGPVNHQWSKGIEFEAGFRALLAGRVHGIEYFSWLRNRSELSIAEVFASLVEFHGVFRSCNRAFHQDPARRLDHWCGVCDKCLFIDLALAPYLSPEALGAIFSGVEPIENPALLEQLEVLIGTSPDPRPFECVGDVAECRAALWLAAQRPDRASSATIQRLARQLGAPPPEERGAHPTFVPERYASRHRVG